MLRPAPVIVTHHAPDLDAIGAVWVLKRFLSQEYATSKVAFVNPGSRLSIDEATQLGVTLDAVTHVDTGFGRYDHHQPERGGERICATSLVAADAVDRHPELEDDRALADLVTFVTTIDHFGEVNWPESEYSHSFLLHEIIRGHELQQSHDDDSQLHFGMQCLDHVYATLKQQYQASTIISDQGIPFRLRIGEAMGIETRNDHCVKVAQKLGYILIIRKDPQHGHVSIKARPDVDLKLSELDTAIRAIDPKATWFYHPSGKMLINGSRKHRHQIPSSLSLEALISLCKKYYA